MLVGVPRPELCEPMARALQSLGVRRGMVVCGRKLAKRKVESGNYLDELSTLGANHVAEFYQERGFSASPVLSPENFPLQPATLADLRGGDKFVNAEIIRRILRGEERGPKRDAVLLNAGAALVRRRESEIARGRLGFGGRNDRFRQGGESWRSWRSWRADVSARRVFCSFNAAASAASIAA